MVAHHRSCVGRCESVGLGQLSATQCGQVCLQRDDVIVSLVAYKGRRRSESRVQSCHRVLRRPVARLLDDPRAEFGGGVGDRGIRCYDGDGADGLDCPRCNDGVAEHGNDQACTIGVGECIGQACLGGGEILHSDHHVRGTHDH